MHQVILLSLLGLLSTSGRDACITVFGIKITLKMPRNRGRQKLRRASEAQRIIHPMRHPGPRYRFVSPEHLKMVIPSASSASTNSAKVGTISPQIIPSYISSASRGTLLLLLSCKISFLCATDQLAPSGFEGSLTNMNLVLASMSCSICSTEALHLLSACRWYILGVSPMLRAMVRARGKPGEGKRKLSPSPPSRLIVTQIAMLPPADKYTSSADVLYAFTLNFSATAFLPRSRPCMLVYPSILPTFFANVAKFSLCVLNKFN